MKQNTNTDGREGEVGAGQPQAPRSITIETADQASNNLPYNPGGTPNGLGSRCPLIGEPVTWGGILRGPDGLRRKK